MDVLGAMEAYALSQGGAKNDKPTKKELQDAMDRSPDTPAARESWRKLKKLSSDERRALMQKRRAEKKARGN